MTLQWTAFGVTAFFALLRVPGVIRGENRGIFAALVLMALAVALGIPFFYLSLDALLGGVNITNLVIRYSLFAIFLILGLKLAVAFNSPRARWLIGGPVGLSVLAAAVAAAAVLFVISDLPESSTALEAYRGQNTVLAYSDVGRVYTAYVAACLAPALSAYAADSRRRRDIRLSAGLISLGMAAVVIHSLLSVALWGLERGAWDFLLNYGAVIVVALGLTIMWNSRRVAKKNPELGSLATVLGSR